MTKNMIKDTLVPVLKGAGFRRKGNDWFCDTDDAILVMSLQKSNFGEQYYLNLAVWLKALGVASEPKEQSCHVRIRATALKQDEQRYWEKVVFNLEDAMPDEERRQMVLSFVEGTALPFLLECGTMCGLRKLQMAGRLNSAAIMARARPLLQGL